MTVSFLEHLGLLDLHGRAAVTGLGQLSPKDPVAPWGESAHRTAVEH